MPTTMNLTPDEAVALLEAAAKSVGSAGKLATRLARDRRVVSFWLAGTKPIPKSVQVWADRLVRDHAQSHANGAIR